MCRKVCFTVLIRERGVLIFLSSLCRGAFCSGFPGHTRLVSGREEVYSQGVPSTGITVGSQIREIEYPALFVRLRNQGMSGM